MPSPIVHLTSTRPGSLPMDRSFESGSRTTWDERQDVIPAAAQPVLSVPAWKRRQDVVLILLSIPFLAPLMCLITLVIKVVSRGPVLFRQDRVGLGGQTFELLKFRTMEDNADCRPHSDYVNKLMESDAPMTKLDLANDNRLIPGGRWLRACALDELPQLFNVLRGTMSLVGPRPCTSHEFSLYPDSQKRRFDVLPGLTGLWQVSGKNRLSFREMITFDEQYADQANWLLDLKILLLTPKAIIGQILDIVRHRKAAAAGLAPIQSSKSDTAER